jgi:hypothetical protein
MTERRYPLARPFRLSLDSYARITGVHPDLVRRFIALGLLEMTRETGARWQRTRATARRARALAAASSGSAGGDWVSVAGTIRQTRSPSTSRCRVPCRAEGWRAGYGHPSVRPGCAGASRFPFSSAPPIGLAAVAGQPVRAERKPHPELVVPRKTRLLASTAI